MRLVCISPIQFEWISHAGEAVYSMIDPICYRISCRRTSPAALRRKIVPRYWGIGINRWRCLRKGDAPTRKLVASPKVCESRLVTRIGQQLSFCSLFLFCSDTFPHRPRSVKVSSRSTCTFNFNQETLSDHFL